MAEIGLMSSKYSPTGIMTISGAPVSPVTLPGYKFDPVKTITAKSTGYITSTRPSGAGAGGNVGSSVSPAPVSITGYFNELREFIDYLRAGSESQGQIVYTNPYPADYSYLIPYLNQMVYFDQESETFLYYLMTILK